MFSRGPSRPPRRAAAILTLAALVLPGCGGGGPPTGVVTGDVTIDGRPANAGSVVFTVKGQSISGQILPDGTYKAVGVPVGEARVHVQPPPNVPAAAPPLPGTEAATPAGKPIPVPGKYQKPESSGLTTAVTAGTTKYKVEMVSH
jgi:hypothetical protein